MIFEISNFLQTNQIQFSSIDRSLFNSYLITINSLDKMSSTIFSLQTFLPKYEIRNIFSTLYISVEPKFKQIQIPTPFKLWLKTKKFVDIRTNIKSSYHKLSKNQKQVITEKYNKNPYLIIKQLKMSDIRIIQKQIKSSGFSSLSIIKLSMFYFKNYPNLQKSYELCVIPFQSFHKFTPKELCRKFIRETLEIKN